MNVSIPKILLNKMNTLSGIDHNPSNLGIIRISIHIKSTNNTITSNVKD